jgi:FkbM family methyltransferase
MEHCFDTGPILTISTLYIEDNICIIDPLSELIANITKQLIQNTSGCFVDIGGYRGKWTDYVHNNCSNIERSIFIYEPAYTAYSILKNKYAKSTRIQLHNLAITSGYKGLAFVDDDQSSRVYNIEDDIYAQHKVINVPGIKYDTIFKNKQVGVVKIRTNGHEMHVLSGMQESMQENNIDAIIFECNGIAYGFYDDELYIHKYLRSLKQRFKYIYAIEREYLHINKIETDEELNIFLYKRIKSTDYNKTTYN